MDNRLTVTFDPALSSMIALRASQEKESNVSGFVARLMRIALDKYVQPNASIAQLRRTVISPELEAFVGIAKPADEKDWKERKEDYLTEKYKM